MQRGAGVDVGAADGAVVGFDVGDGDGADDVGVAVGAAQQNTWLEKGHSSGSAF